MSDFQVWLKKVLVDLRKLFKLFIDDKESISKLLSSPNFPIWTKAFTHMSHDINLSYETLEHIGDRICDWAFKAYAMQRFPNKNPIVYTYLTNRYMEKVYQRSVIKRFNLEQHIRGFFYNDIVPFTVGGDVFESIVGAMFLAGEGLGFYLVYKFLKFLMDTEEIDLKKLQQGPGITLIDQMFARLQIPPPKLVETSTSGNSVTLSLAFNPVQKERLSELGIRVPNTLCTCTRSFMKHAQKDLYEIACDKLSKCGLDHHWAKRWKSDKDMESVAMLPWKATIDEYVERKNFRYLYKVPGQCNLDDSLYSVRIFGVKKDREESAELLYSTWTSVEKDYSTLYAYSQFFSSVSSAESVSLKKEVTDHFSKLGFSGSSPADLRGKVWMRSLKKTLNKVFSTFIDDADVRSSLLDGDHIGGWVSAFTDETYDIARNNISLVQLGHNVIKATLAYQVLTIFPNGDPALLSNTNIYFIEGPRQAKLAETLKLNTVMRCKPAVMTGHPYVKRTSLQAFMGILSQMGNLGPRLCFKFIDVHFPRKVLDTPWLA